MLNSPAYLMMAQGNFHLGWALEEGETEEDLQNCRYIGDEERKEFIEKAYKGEVDPLHLVKWRQLSYMDTTWEPESLIKDKYQTLIHESDAHNRS
jgi:hypothetical protein